jgi:hypothetical protein
MTWCLSTGTTLSSQRNGIEILMVKCWSVFYGYVKNIRSFDKLSVCEPHWNWERANMRLYSKVSGLAAWSENRKCDSSLPLVQLYRYFVSQSSEFCRHNPLCCFSTSVYCYCLFRYRLSPETFGYNLVCSNCFMVKVPFNISLCS